MEPKECLHCLKRIQGRSDKKFCDNQCRNAFNNTQNGVSNNFIRKLNRIIKKNRGILEELCPTDKSVKVHRKELTKQGFSFEYFTNIYTTKAAKTYYFCYEFGYLDLGADYFALVVNKKALKDL